MVRDFSKITAPFLSDQDLRVRADEFRAKYWGEKLPVDVELIAERSLNLYLIPINDLRYLAQTEAFLSGDLKEMVYDPQISETRIRFSIAHEIGHYVLHRDIIKTLRPSSYEEWRLIQGEIPEALWARVEYQAREFAGRLLVPQQLLIQELRKVRPLIEKAKHQIPDLEDQAIKEYITPTLGRRFHVSAEVIDRRMIAEGISPLVQ